MALAKIILRIVNGIDRPTIASVIPGKAVNRFGVDRGANAECSMQIFVDFATMGEALAMSIFKKEDVKLVLLNIGTEEAKGSRLVKESTEILKKLFENYMEFIEGNDFGKEYVDVIVADDLTGSVALKMIKGTAKCIVLELKDATLDSLLSKIEAAFAISPPICQRKT
jgi:glycerol-3-phosphate acyltransferase PlsX